jgi:hypothetical protein
MSNTEFDQLVITSNGVPPLGKLDGNTKLQTVTIGGSASAPFQPIRQSRSAGRDQSAGVAVK